MRHLAIFLLLALLLGASTGTSSAQPLPNQDGVTVILRPGQERAQLDGVLETLRRSERPVTLRWEPAPPAAAAAITGQPGDGSSSTSLMRLFENGLAARLAGIRRLGELPGLVAKAWSADQNDLGLLRVAAALGIALGFAFLVRALFPQKPEPAGGDLNTLARMRESLPPLARNIAAGVVFGVVGWAAMRMLLPATDLAQLLGSHLVRAGAMVAAFAVIGTFLLSPWVASRRILPLPDAPWHFAMLTTYAALGGLAETGIAFVVGAGADRELAQGYYLLVSTALTVFKVGWFLVGRHDIATLLRGEASAPFSGRAVLAAAVPYLLCAIAILIWLASIVASASPAAAVLGTAAGATQVVAILFPIIAVLAESISRELAGRHDASRAAHPLRSAAASGIRRLLLGAVLIGTLYGLARVWAALVADPEVVMGLRATIRIAAALVAGWAIWGFLHAYFEAHLPRHAASGPGEDEPETLVATRLTTVMPILRDLGLGAVFAVTALAVLSAVGVDIGPLLAGFGVIGLAISFGSQALVRDIVSGIFFLTDDAFRIGEYIDTGKLKGTVERITLRSVQLRHQNGQIHTVPFGTISQITNFSRDWATMKFTIRLDREADIEKTRKVIKKVGQDMLADPEIGSEFLQLLKMQGVQEIADGAIVIRCKFTAKPNKPTFIQRQALRRIHEALRAAGIEFASNAVSFRSGAASSETDKAAAASGARPPDPVPVG